MSLSDNLRRLARERIPTGAGEVARSYHSYGAYQRFNSNQRQDFGSVFLNASWTGVNVDGPTWNFRSIYEHQRMLYGYGHSPAIL